MEAGRSKSEMDAPIVVVSIVSQDLYITARMKAQKVHMYRYNLALCCRPDFSMTQKSDQVVDKQCHAQLLLNADEGGHNTEFGTSSDF